MKSIKKFRFLIKLNMIFIKELMKPMFNENSSLVKSAVLLIMAGLMTEDEIPNVSNLREVVLQILAK